LLYPFVLTFCGLSLIYAGMIFDGDAVLNVISVDWLYVDRATAVTEFLKVFDLYAVVTAALFKK
jgi:hypothetical protein